jgi:hypothetical protein
VEVATAAALRLAVDAAPAAVVQFVVDAAPAAFLRRLWMQRRLPSSGSCPRFL